MTTENFGNWKVQGGKDVCVYWTNRETNDSQVSIMNMKEVSLCRIRKETGFKLQATPQYSVQKENTEYINATYETYEDAYEVAVKLMKDHPEGLPFDLSFFALSEQTDKEDFTMKIEIHEITDRENIPQPETPEAIISEVCSFVEDYNKGAVEEIKTEIQELIKHGKSNTQAVWKVSKQILDEGRRVSRASADKRLLKAGIDLNDDLTEEQENQWLNIEEDEEDKVNNTFISCFVSKAEALMIEEAFNQVEKDPETMAGFAADKERLNDLRKNYFMHVKAWDKLREMSYKLKIEN